MNKKKVFPRVDLGVSGGRPGPQLNHGPGLGEDGPPAIKRVCFPVKGNATSCRSFDFSPWYDQGIDQITLACQRQIERFLSTHDGDLTVATVVASCRSGLRYLLAYLVLYRKKLRRKLSLADIHRTTIDGFVAFLNDGGTKLGTRRSIYSHAKTVLTALGHRGLIQVIEAGPVATFPTKPFPSASLSVQGEQPLPKAQRLALAAALRAEMAPIFTQDTLPTARQLSCAVLVTALYTGRNTTPLLELGHDCLRSHPQDRMRFLFLRKRRGNSVSQAALRGAPDKSEVLPAIGASALRIIEQVILLTEPYRANARPEHRDRIWLHHARDGSVISLTNVRLVKETALFVQDSGLRGSDGKPLRVNISRLRKTFINRVNELLDGDVVATAAAAGNTPKIVSMHYLRPGEEAQKNWKFMGRALTQELLDGTVGATAKTPVGRCTDGMRGEFAPQRDGSLCMSFLDCLRCRNYVVTSDDLHRLFSFYWRVYRERGRMDVRKWERRLAHIPRLIDRDVIAEGLRRKVFKLGDVEAARERARTSPHPFWSGDDAIGSLL